MNAGNPPVFNAPPATLVLCAALVAAWLAMHVFGDGLGTVGWLFLDSADPLTPALLGHAFVHAGFTHLLMNAGMLLAFAAVVERRFGAGHMLGIFSVSAVAGGLAFAAVVGLTGRAAWLIGASGAVHGITGAAALILCTSGTPRSRRIGVSLFGFMIVVNAAMALLGDTGDLFGFRFGWQAHLGGLAAGVLAAAILLRPGRER